MELAVDECGPENAPTLLLVHGPGHDRQAWSPVVTHLATEFHCLTPDLPGHGDSPAFVSVADCAERLHALIKAKAHKRAASVVGVSLGAQALLELMARFPGRVGKAVLCSISVRPEPVSTWSRLNPFRQIPAPVKAGRAYGPPEGIEHVTVPTLLLTGDREATHLHGSASDLVGRMRNARAGTVRDAGEGWGIADPGLFADIVHAWMAGKPLPARIQGLTELPPVEVPDGPIRPPEVIEDEGDWWEE